MELFGRAAWWLPRWLGWLPHLDLDGPVDRPAQAERATY